MSHRRGEDSQHPYFRLLGKLVKDNPPWLEAVHTLLTRSGYAYRHAMPHGSSKTRHGV